MTGDYTRFTFKPHKDYSGVLKQQGRVDLDADFNELIEIIDRRWRSETIDILSHCAVAGATHDAFLVTPTAIGAFEIGIGRMYVDGIQVENHGLPPLAYLADLGELRGTAQVPYADQPYLPAPLPPPLGAAPGTTDLVYLDVWQREVTVLEDPAIREIALGGPDTTTRIQSLWQVRVLEDVGEHGCGDKIQRWDDTVALSAGRLTTSAVAPPASDDPCIISPSGGYRGLENRLYRVEIHATGPIGGITPAKFKWSRNNATISSTVSAIAPGGDTVTVQQVGRDQVLRFEVGNWIEILDDWREFQGLAGHMAQVTAIDEANRVLSFAPAIVPAMNFNPADPGRHTRVRRWDQTQNVDGNGLLDVVAGPIDIEDGIRVDFSLDPAGGNFRIGDYWVFAARTADGSVESLQGAPPRGILHHYCRLGFIAWGADLETTTFTDCRIPPTPECACGTCTVTVGDGVDSHGQFTDIAQAIDALGNAGGIVCIGRGFYHVSNGLVLDGTKRNVILRGVGPATRIFFAPQEGAAGVFLHMTGTEHVRLESVFVAAAAAEALVRMSDSHFCQVTDCTLVNLPGQPGGQLPVARTIDLAGFCSGCEIARNALVGGKAVASTSGRVNDLLIRDNHMLALQVAILVHQAQDLEIFHNQLRGLPPKAFPTGLKLSRATIDEFERLVAAVFREPPSLANFQAAGVLVFTGKRVVIFQNLITAQVAVLGYLFLNVRIHQNDIVSLIGVLDVFGIRVKIEDNFVLGLFAGLIHAGFVVDLDCTSNEWLGLHGIVWMSLGEFTKAFGTLIGGALGAAGLAAAAPLAVKDTARAGGELAGEPGAFGLALINKVHRNVFFTFARGIYKTAAVVSADVSILDNSFSFCALAGIELAGNARNDALLVRLLPTINLRHAINCNALTVQGKGILCSTLLTHLEQNSIQCPRVAIELDAPFCTAHANTLVGTVRELAPFDTGLLSLHASAAAARVSANRVVGAPSHAILVLGDLSELAIDDNDILDARRSGIGTVSDTTVVRRSSVSRNRIVGCGGAVEGAPMSKGGAIFIGESHDLRIIDNVVTDNKLLVPGSYAICLDSGENVEIAGNTVVENAEGGTIDTLFGGILVQLASGVIRIQDNVVRDNGGVALVLGEGGEARGIVQQVLVQNNRLSEEARPALALALADMIESLLFQGNQCVQAKQLMSVPAVYLNAARANVSGNVVDVASVEAQAMLVQGNDLVVSANSVRTGPLSVQGAAGASRAIVTSNLCSAISAVALQLVFANNLP
jgi:hypothetical protein